MRIGLRHADPRSRPGRSGAAAWLGSVPMSSHTTATDRFLEMHRAGAPLLIPNPWDVGSAKVLAQIGFSALATTSSGFAATLGRPDGSVTRDEALDHATAITAATGLPVSADLENGFADDPAQVAETVRRAAALGLAGCSIEDFTGEDDNPIYDPALAAERIRAAAETGRGHLRIVLTARAENYLHGRPDLADTITRLQSYQEAGADVLYAPGLRDLGDIRSVVTSVDLPVNVLLLPGGPTVTELAESGVRRISVGGTFFYAALGALADAGRELLHYGTSEFFGAAATGRAAAAAAFRG